MVKKYNDDESLQDYNTRTKLLIITLLSVFLYHLFRLLLRNESKVQNAANIAQKQLES